MVSPAPITSYCKLSSAGTRAQKQCVLVAQYAANQCHRRPTSCVVRPLRLRAVPTRQRADQSPSGPPPEASKAGMCRTLPAVHTKSPTPGGKTQTRRTLRRLSHSHSHRHSQRRGQNPTDADRRGQNPQTGKPSPASRPSAATQQRAHALTETKASLKQQRHTRLRNNKTVC